MVSDFTQNLQSKQIISKCNKTGGGFIILSEIILILWKKIIKFQK